MRNLEYRGLGAEWLQPILELEDEQNQKQLLQCKASDAVNAIKENSSVESSGLKERCNRTIDMFDGIENKTL